MTSLLIAMQDGNSYCSPSSSLLPLIPQPNFCYFIHIRTHTSNIFYIKMLICSIFTDLSERYVFIKCLKNWDIMSVILNVKHTGKLHLILTHDKFLSFFSSSDYFRFLPNFYEDTMREFSANGGFKMFHNKLSVIYQVIGDNFPMRCHFKVHFSSVVCWMSIAHAHTLNCSYLFCQHSSVQ